MKKIAVIVVILSSVFFCNQHAFAQFEVGIGVQIRIAPPEIPVYVQPACPTDGYLWTPGYWAYGPNGYYWVPGVWVQPARPGFLWTPGYWGYTGGYYGWNQGYWGEHVGYYGGVCYGYGYGGSGYYGGRWEGGSFRYNTAVSNVNANVIHNTYSDRTVIQRGGSRAAFNGPGGVVAHPTAGEQAARNESHIAPTQAQTSHAQTASRDRSQLATVNKGRPATAAMSTVNARPANNGGAANRGNAGGANNRMQNNNQGRQPRNNPQQAGQQQHNQPQRNNPQQAARPQQQAPQRQQQPQQAPPRQQQQPQQQPHNNPQQSAPRPQQQPRSNPQQGGEREQPHGGGEGRR
jgi:hypothetical protein